MIKTPGPGQYERGQLHKKFKKQINRKCYTGQENTRKKIMAEKTKYKNLFDEQANRNK